VYSCILCDNNNNNNNTAILPARRVHTNATEKKNRRAVIDGHRSRAHDRRCSDSAGERAKGLRPYRHTSARRRVAVFAVVVIVVVVVADLREFKDIIGRTSFAPMAHTHTHTHNIVYFFFLRIASLVSFSPPTDRDITAV